MAQTGDRGAGGKCYAYGATMSDTIRVLVVGLGRAGMVHARNHAGTIPGSRLAAVADPDPAARERAATELGCEQVYDDPVRAAAEADVDAVVIASPTFTHADVAVAALDAGRHVLCEKPLASSGDEAAKIARAARASDCHFLMGFMRRFDAGFCRAAERIEAGDIGTPLLVRSTGRGPGLPPEWAQDPARSLGLFAEVNSHDFDTVRWLSGQEFASVWAVGRAAKRPDLTERHPGFLDVAMASFELDGGALAQIDGACPADYGYDARAEVYGSEGAILVGDPAARGPLLLSGRGTVETDAVRSWRELFAVAYRAEDAHFVAVARGEEEPRTTLGDGLRALQAVLATNRSMDERRQVSCDELPVA
ncbi:MAG: oxidoreductase [Streptosporangiales bacterium]|nr:oxidoreductase [Streptosporangiales bacterium]